MRSERNVFRFNLCGVQLSASGPNLSLRPPLRGGDCDPEQERNLEREASIGGGGAEEVMVEGRA